MKHKTQLAAVTNLQGVLSLAQLKPALVPLVPSPNYASIEEHRRFFKQSGLYHAALLGDAMMWDEGKPEWQRETKSNFEGRV